MAYLPLARPGQGLVSNGPATAILYGLDYVLTQQKILGRTSRLLSFNNIDSIKNGALKNSVIIECIFVAARKCLLSCLLATIDEYTYRHTDSKVISLANFCFLKM
jgi:hypothetical protein